MQLQTFGTWSATIGSVGAGALTQSPQYSFLALPVAIASGVLWLLLLLVFLYRNRVIIWNWIRGTRRRKMSIGLALIIGACAMGVIGLSIIAAGDPPVSKTEEAADPNPSSPDPKSKMASPLARESLLGFSTQLNLEIRNVAELRRQFIFQNITPEKSKASFYLSANDRFVFSITDIRDESYTLDVPVGSKGIPIYRPIFLVCEAGLGSNETYMRILVDGVEIAERTLPYRMDLGSRNWSNATMGADAQGKQNSAFVISTWSFGHVTLLDEDILDIEETTAAFLRSKPQNDEIIKQAGNSNADLKRRTLELTPRMRVFQQGVTQAFTRLYAKWPQDPQQINAFRESEAGKRYAQEQYELMNRYTAEADQQFRSEALALRDEMERKLGRLPPYPRERKETIWLDTNNMAGPSALSWTADYLEELARKLPQ
jgi:hypothetical protein